MSRKSRAGVFLERTLDDPLDFVSTSRVIVVHVRMSISCCLFEGQPAQCDSLLTTYLSRSAQTLLHNKAVSMSEEEDKLLASVQANVVDQSEYEGSVLRQANRATAPILSTTGFPANDEGFEPNVVWNIVSKTRKEIETDPDNERLHMKLQLLLHWSGGNQRNRQQRQQQQDMSRTWKKLERLEMERSKRLYQGTAAKDPSIDQGHDVMTMPQAQQPRKRIPIMKRKYASLEGDEERKKKPALKKAKK